MKLRVKELAKQQGITLQELADRMNINRVNLSASIHGNPTINQLEKIANALGVTVNELLPLPSDEVRGYIEIKGKIIKVTSIDDLKKIITDLEK